MFVARLSAAFAKSSFEVNGLSMPKKHICALRWVFRPFLEALVSLFFVGWAISGFLVLGSIILVGRFTTHCWNSWSKKKKNSRERLNKETFKSNKTCFGLNLEGVKITQCAIDWVVSRILFGLFSHHHRCVCVYIPLQKGKWALFKGTVISVSLIRFENFKTSERTHDHRMEKNLF